MADKQRIDDPDPSDGGGGEDGGSDSQGGSVTVGTASPGDNSDANTGSQANNSPTLNLRPPPPPPIHHGPPSLPGQGSVPSTPATSTHSEPVGHEPEPGPHRPIDSPPGMVLPFGLPPMPEHAGEPLPPPPTPVLGVDQHPSPANLPCRRCRYLEWACPARTPLPRLHILRRWDLPSLPPFPHGHGSCPQRVSPRPVVTPITGPLRRTCDRRPSRMVSKAPGPISLRQMFMLSTR